MIRIGALKPLVRRAAIAAARATVGKVPPPASRLTGRPAQEGGVPVRDIRFRPWPDYHALSSSELDWWLRVGPVMRSVFRSGLEGLPQTLSHRFGAEWAAYCGARFGLLLPHGTDALRIMIAAALNTDGLEYGGEIIVPNLTFIASATCALDRRVGVALVDVDPVSLNLDPRSVEEAIVPGRTRAIMAVHSFGQTADMAALRDVAARHSLLLLEDAAQAHGAVHDLGRAGALGDAAGFSFQATKNLPSGEGGALTTNNEEIYERALAMHNVGRARFGGERWGHEVLGWNCRPSEYVAAVLLHRMRLLDAQNVIRDRRMRELREALVDYPCVEPVGLAPGCKLHAGYMFVLRYHSEHCGGLTLDDFLKALSAEGLPATRGYAATLSQQSAFQRVAERYPEYIRILDTPVSDAAVQQIFYLPNHVLLSGPEGVQEIAAAFRKLQEFHAPQAKRSPAVREVPQGPAPQRSAVTPTARAGEPAVAPPLRIGIVGSGVQGRQHAAALANHSRARLAAMTDVRLESARALSAEFGGRVFASPEELVHSGEADAVVIATPHWQHAELSIAALQAGLHVLCEKPLAVTVADADSVLDAAGRSDRVFAMVYQTRLEPAYQYARRMLESGELGDIYRCQIVESAWRTAAYYRSSPWRGTWKGEGGGVLLNQAPHVLDRYAWLFGMPETVLARCDTNLHPIEVEDTASAVLRHANGAHGYIHVSTAEAPSVSRTVVACDRGRLTIENGKIQLVTLQGSIRERSERETGQMVEMPSSTRELSSHLVGAVGELLREYYEDFAAAVADGKAPACPGAEGLHAVELANAIILSSHRRSEVALPLDRDEYSALMSRFIEGRSVEPRLGR
jgi:dTDP-4-amino-4,6-dideoxygalactose transaminase/predicted dehydrogenase